MSTLNTSINSKEFSLKAFLITLNLLVLSCFTLLAQSKDDYKIPFKLTEQNNIIISATLNGVDTVSLMFHTAASDLTLTSAAIEKMKSLRFERTDTVQSWGGGNNSSRFSKSNVLEIAGRKWTEIPLWENLNSGPGSGGKFGLELFEGKAIAIDFDKKLITVYDRLPSGLSSFNKLSLTYKDEMMFVKATVKIGDKLLENLFLIHSGYSGSILFDDKFTSENQLDEKLTITSEKSLKDSFGNILKTKKANIPSLTLGKTRLDHVPVGFFAGAIGRQKMSVIGGDLLKRFNIIISADRETIYIKANKLKASPYSNI